MAYTEMVFSEAEREALEWLDSLNLKKDNPTIPEAREEVRKRWKGSYKRVLRKRIKDKVKQMKEDLKLYKRNKEKLEDLFRY